MKIIAEIPARAGSQRVKNKNLRDLNGKPLISYAISAALESKLLTDVFVNTDSDDIGNYSVKQGARFYKRSAVLASDHATSDQYNYDFFQYTGADILVQVNPVCPFVTATDIDFAIRHFLDNGFDSLITVREERFQAFYDGKPLNFDIEKKLPRTQDITPVILCAWPISIWRRTKFMENYEKAGHAVFSGNLCLYPVPLIKAIKISYEEDFAVAEKLMQIT